MAALCAKFMAVAPVASDYSVVRPWTCICRSMVRLRVCEPVWPSGKALGWSAGLQFDSAAALLSLQKLWSVDTVPHK